MQRMRNPTSLGVAVFVAVSVAVTMTSATAQTSEPTPGADVAGAEDQIVLSGTVTVPRGRSVGEVVVFHGRALVAGVVAGDVVVLDGPIVVSGQVSGSVVALNGPIRLGASASVGRDVLGAHGVRLEPGALVAGELRDHVAFTPRGALTALGKMVGTVAIAVSLLLTLLLLVAIAPRALDGVASAATSSPVVSMAWGLVVSVTLPVLAVAAAASIVALPLGLAAGLAAGLLWMLGLAFGGFAIGRIVTGRSNGRARPLLAGWGLVAAIGLVPFLNVVVWVLGAAFGLGAALVATWRARSAAPTRGRHRIGYSRPRPAVASSAVPGSEVPSSAVASSAVPGSEPPTHRDDEHGPSQEAAPKAEVAGPT